MDAFEIIGAFVDSERVDPEGLKAALATDEGRQYLIDLVALRELTSGDAHGAFVAPATTSVTSVDGGRVWRRLAAAAAVIVSLGGGYVAGRYAAPASPANHRVVDARPRSGEVVPAPQPTSIIKLQPGVDWHERITRN